MLSSTTMVHSTFPQNLSRLLPFNTLNCFAVHFKIVLIRFLCISACTSVLLFIQHWQGRFLIVRHPVERFKRGHAYILSDLELPVLPYVSPITTISGCQSIDYITSRNCLVSLWEGDLSLSKVYDGPLGYSDGKSLTLRNHFIQPYRVLDTLFSKC